MAALLLSSYAGMLREENDPIFRVSSMDEVLRHDLLLLENQLPWMVLEHLFIQMGWPFDLCAIIPLAHPSLVL
jgi:hypothetical protein